MSLRRRVLRYVALVTAVAMALGAFAGSAERQEDLEEPEGFDLEAAPQADQEEPARNPQQVVPAEGRSSQLQAPGHDPHPRRLPGRLRRRRRPVRRARVNTGLNERSQYTADVDLGPSLGQRKVSIAGSLAAEVQFRDSYDGGALGNVSIEILPSTTKTISTSSVPLLWNPDVDSLSSRTDANFARAAIRAGASVAGALRLHGWEHKRPGLHRVQERGRAELAYVRADRLVRRRRRR